MAKDKTPEFKFVKKKYMKEIDFNKKITKPVKIKFDKSKKERIPLFIVYKEDGLLKTDVSEDIADYELWGFLKIFIKRMGKLLERGIEERKDEGVFAE